MDKNKRLLKETINKAVKRALIENQKENLDIIIESVLKEKLETLLEYDEGKTNKKRAVIKWLQKPEVNTA
jgi:hypothetical protein